MFSEPDGAAEEVEASSAVCVKDSAVSKAL